MTETNPFQKNMCVELVIDGMTSEGQGVGHLNGVAFFVPETCVEERVSAHIIKVEKRFCIAKAVEILSPSTREKDCTIKHQREKEALKPGIKY